MKLGIVFPTTEIEPTPGAARRFAEAAEAAGYDHIVAYDHVLGANPASPHGRRARYKHTDAFHEPFVLFGFMAAVTRRIELFTGIVVLPMRQTALAAKQAAEVDVLSEGRLRLGVAVGPNAFEYDAMGADFGDRGRRIEEQIDLMRRLWAEPLVSYTGRWHRVDDAGINPLPPRRDIPVWCGGAADAVLRRTARLCAGWYALQPPGEQTLRAIADLRRYVREAGRAEDAVGIEGRIPIGDRPLAAWLDDARWWRDAGATHVSLHTMDGGRRGVEAHLAELHRFREAFATLR